MALPFVLVFVSRGDSQGVRAAPGCANGALEFELPAAEGVLRRTKKAYAATVLPFLLTHFDFCFGTRVCGPQTKESDRLRPSPRSHLERMLLFVFACFAFLPVQLNLPPQSAAFQLHRALHRSLG